MDISVSLTSVRGERQGIPKLTLNLAVEGQTDVQLAIISVTAAVRVTQEMTVHDMSKSYFIGTGFLESRGGQLSRNSKTSWQIGIPLSPYQLQKIEDMRGGKDLFLNVQFFCTAASRVTTPSPLINDISYPSVGVSGYSDGYCPFKVAQSDWEKTLIDLGAPELLDAEALIRLASEQAQETLREIQDVAAKAKEAASITGVAQHASYFKEEADGYKRSSSKWLAWTVILAVAAAGYSLWSFRFAPIHAVEGSASWWPHVTYLTSRLIVLSVIFFGMGWSARNYRAHKHNEIVNRHRQNALRTFETFAVAASDPATKDAVLIAATKSIFEAQSSGYLAGEPEKVPSGTVIEVLKNAISTRGPS
jgi:hypothetical protein